ncbi:hypothetical protein AAG570_006523 [Ranatra chinensis]|uniref:Uncharacterized protein n=1 Tax=Ranatra chinensis TaxID=642074 RepID=A0ABD0YUK7_9HEMI
MMYALLLLLGLTIPTRGWLSPKLISSSRSGDTSSQGEIEPEEEALEKNFNGLISQYDLPMAFDFIEEIFSPKIDVITLLPSTIKPIIIRKNGQLTIFGDLLRIWQVEVIQPRKDFLMLEHHPKACRKTDESKQGTWHRVKRERPKQIHYISHKNATRKHSIAHKNNATEKDNRLEAPQSEPAHKGVIAVDALTVPNWGWKFPDLIPFRSKETKTFNGGSKPEVEELPLLFVREFIDPQYDSSKQVDAIGPYDKVVEMVFTTDSHSGFQQTGGNKMHEHGHRKDESGQHHCRNVLHTDYNNSTDKARNQTLTELIAINAKGKCMYNF